MFSKDNLGNHLAGWDEGEMCKVKKDFNFKKMKKMKLKLKNEILISFFLTK